MSRSAQRVMLGFSAVLVLTSLLFGEENAQQGKNPDTNFENLPPLLDGIKKVAKPVIYEGLPKENSEPEVFQNELHRAKTVELHGYRFYDGVRPLNEDDAEKLRKLLNDPKAFEKFSGGKFCGGFHPDYLIEWKSGDDVYQAQFCFGCSEMRCFGPKHELLCDIHEDAYKQLAKILHPYRKNRPKPKYDLIERAARP